MNVGDIAAAVSGAVLGHHDLFAAELSKLLIPGLKMDPFAAAILMGSIMATAEPQDVKRMRRWKMEDWQPAIKKVIASRGTSPAPAQAPTAPTTPTPQGAPYADVQIEVPPMPKPPSAPSGAAPPNIPTPPAPPSGGGGGGGGPPRWMTDGEKYAWTQARTRAGEFARGLGNYIDQKTGQMVFEVWDKEKILRDADPQKRQQVLDIIRNKVVEAQEQGKTSDMLAKELAKATGDWGRNWGRIARTEIQGAYNEGVIMEHVRWDGPGALIARVPEASACVDCRRLFLDDSGNPKIFTAKELVDNGVNVGKPRRDWVATAWPVHPNCRCDTQAIPEGMLYGSDGLLKFEGE